MLFIADHPLPYPATLVADRPAPFAPEQPAISVRADHTVRLAAGDLVVVEDGALEWARMAADIVLPMGRTLWLPLQSALRLPHAAGGPVLFVRPMRIVRYAVVFLEWPEMTSRVPCLVRFQTPAPHGWVASGEAAGWPEPTMTDMEVIAERVSVFRVESLSPDLFRICLETRGWFPCQGSAVARDRMPRGLSRKLLFLAPRRANP